MILNPQSKLVHQEEVKVVVEDYFHFRCAESSVWEIQIKIGKKKKKKSKLSSNVYERMK